MKLSVASIAVAVAGVFWALQAHAGDGRPPEEDVQRAWARYEDMQTAFRGVFNDLAAVHFASEMRIAKERWRMLSGQRDGRIALEQSAWAESLKSGLYATQEFEDRIMLARTEAAAIYFLERMRGEAKMNYAVSESLRQKETAPVPGK